MQQTVEGVKVRNVVGQAIVIYTTGAKQTRIAEFERRRGRGDATSRQQHEFGTRFAGDFE